MNTDAVMCMGFTKHAQLPLQPGALPSGFVGCEEVTWGVELDITCWQHVIGVTHQASNHGANLSPCPKSAPSLEQPPFGVDEQPPTGCMLDRASCRLPLEQVRLFPCRALKKRTDFHLALFLERAEQFCPVYPVQLSSRVSAHSSAD